jgi:hypothetical protein
MTGRVCISSMPKTERDTVYKQKFVECGAKYKIQLLVQGLENAAYRARIEGYF